MDDVFAQGMLFMAYLGRLLKDRISGTGSARSGSASPRSPRVHGEPTCRARITTVQDGLATLEISVALSDGTTTLIGDATVAVD